MPLKNLGGEGRVGWVELYNMVVRRTYAGSLIASYCAPEPWYQCILAQGIVRLVSEGALHNTIGQCSNVVFV